jgi:acetylornithine/succinyldiaminopimelate/putrescine aminotransferase
VAAIKEQAEKYLHVMVYGELVQSPQVQYAAMLAAHMPDGLDCVYFTNSGAEATEGALKLARRVTGRTDIVCCNKAYHGNTLGALSLMGDEYWRNAFRPLMPGVGRYDYNSDELISAINDHTACVVVETIQGEAGVVAADAGWLRRVRQRCSEMGALLVLDEIQCGFGRTGKLWGFEHYDIVPDVVLLGKALGAGMPMGAFIASHTLMNELTYAPVLGHITTFGGHPVCCAAGMAGLTALLGSGLMEEVAGKEQLFRELLAHPAIREVRSKGLLMAVELAPEYNVANVLKLCTANGLFSDWFLFAPGCIRIAPPLTITTEEIKTACETIKGCLTTRE